MKDLVEWVLEVWDVEIWWGRCLWEEWPSALVASIFSSPWHPFCQLFPRGCGSLISEVSAPGCSYLISQSHRWRSCFSLYFFHVFLLKNVNCEYDRLNDWNSTLEAAWYIRHVRWASLFYTSYIIRCLWNQPTYDKVVLKKYRRWKNSNRTISGKTFSSANCSCLHL